MEVCSASVQGQGSDLRAYRVPNPVPEKKPFHSMLEDVAMVDLLDAIVIEVRDERWSFRKLLCESFRVLGIFDSDDLKDHLTADIDIDGSAALSTRESVLNQIRLHLECNVIVDGAMVDIEGKCSAMVSEIIRLTAQSMRPGVLPRGHGSVHLTPDSGLGFGPVLHPAGPSAGVSSTSAPFGPPGAASSGYPAEAIQEKTYCDQDSDRNNLVDVSLKRPPYLPSLEEDLLKTLAEDQGDDSAGELIEMIIRETQRLTDEEINAFANAVYNAMLVGPIIDDLDRYSESIFLVGNMPTRNANAQCEHPITQTQPFVPSG